MIKCLFIYLMLIVSVTSKGGAGKCAVCPSCMVCDPLIGCMYDNFSPCTGTSNLKGYCINGSCNTTIGNTVLSKPAVCKTYKLTRVVTNGVVKFTTTLVNDINGLSCTTVGAALESVCVKGTCTPYTLGIDKFGNPTGCSGLPDGFMCDTNQVFTDGEKCINQKCVMPSDLQSLCLL